MNFKKSINWVDLCTYKSVEDKYNNLHNLTPDLKPKAQFTIQTLMGQESKPNSLIWHYK